MVPLIRRGSLRSVAIGTAVAACLLASQAAAQNLASPWPVPASVAGVPGKEVTFPSHSPFTLADVGAGPARDPKTVAHGTLYLPKGASAGRPVPAVVLLHGAGGVMYPREPTYARQLAARGVAALVVDVFGARRNRAVAFIDRIIEITEAMYLADAYAALRFLRARPDIAGDRVVLIGFSYGGMVATYAAYAMVAERYARDGARFAGHVAFYAPCIAEFRDNRASGAPLLMLYGGRDAIVDPERCARVAGELRAGGARVTTIVYRNAMHQWDGYFNGPFRRGRSLASCRLVVERDGTVRDGRLLIPMVNNMTRALILGLCADSKGFLIGRDDRVRARSNRALGRFLEGVFRAGR